VTLSTTGRPAQQRAAIQEVGLSDERGREDRSAEYRPPTAFSLDLIRNDPEVWRHVAAEVNRDPYGCTADKVLQMVSSADLGEPIPAIVGVIADARERLQATERSEVARYLCVAEPLRIERTRIRHAHRNIGCRTWCLSRR
jgi:hypothetical protein